MRWIAFSESVVCLLGALTAWLSINYSRRFWLVIPAWVRLRRALNGFFLITIASWSWLVMLDSLYLVFGAPDLAMTPYRALVFRGLSALAFVFLIWSLYRR